MEAFSYDTKVSADNPVDHRVTVRETLKLSPSGMSRLYFGEFDVLMENATSIFM
jgi:hypothetical protein